MEEITAHIVRHAQALAQEIGARALVLYADAVFGDGQLRGLVQAVDLPLVLVTRSTEAGVQHAAPSHTWVTVPDVRMTRAGQVKAALLVCLARGVLQRGDRVVCLTGVSGSRSLDMLLVLNVGTEPELFSSLLDSVVLPEDVRPEVFERVLTLATQLSVEGREGRPVGTLFVLGDSERVLAQSRRLVLNPFQGHPEEERNLLDPAVGETIKEFSALDGAFVVRGDGVVLSAGTMLVPTVRHGRLPGGLGTRHAAAAGITASTNAVALCISQSTGTVSVFKSGKLVTELQRPSNGNRLAI
jgi:DNA integrity scanning protein DisA with diadenylate cyclase activity